MSNLKLTDVLRDLRDQTIDIWKRTCMLKDRPHNKITHATESGEIDAFRFIEHAISA